MERFKALWEKRAVRALAYMAFMVTVLMLCLAVTFPDERIKQIMIVQAEAQLNKGKSRTNSADRFWKVQIEDLDLWWFSGVELHDVTLKEKWSLARQEQADQDAEEGKPPQFPMTLEIPRVAARLSLMQSVINLGPAVVVDVDFEEVDGGAIAGTFIQRSDGMFIDARFEELDLYKSKMIEGMTKVPGFGTLSGEVALTLDPKTRLPIDGQMDFTGSKLSIGPADVKVDSLPSMAYLEVPSTSMGTMRFRSRVELKGKTPVFVVDEMSSKGRDMEMDIWGEVRLNKNVARSQSDMKVRLKFDEEFVKEEGLAPVLNIQTLRSGRNGQGWYGVSMKGPLSKITPRGDLAVARGPAEKKAERPEADAAEQPEGDEAKPPKTQRAKKPRTKQQ